MLARLSNFRSVVIASIIICSLAIGYTWHYWRAEGPSDLPVTLLFKPGAGFSGMVEELGQAGVIRSPFLFKALAMGLGQARHFKAGEYAFPAHISVRDIMDMLAQGKVVIHKVTVVEGLNVRQVTALLAQDDALSGEMPQPVAEGSLLPETYHFTRGDKRADLISRMQVSMKKTLDALWPGRDPGLPYATPQQALILASIVEKETGIASERPRVARVFLNRLARGMKLQSDPTVAYGIEQATGAELTRSLTTADLHTPTAYNTYVIDGLPPAPIANPGKAALQAVLHPEAGDELYFVATGNGGHYFARTLDEHNANVQAYRRSQRR